MSCVGLKIVIFDGITEYIDCKPCIECECSLISGQRFFSINFMSELDSFAIKTKIFITFSICLTLNLLSRQ